MRALRPVEGIPGVYSDGEGLFTVNAAPGISVYGERLLSSEGVEYRAWDPKRSKLAALILLGKRGLSIDERSNVLYLGAASGTTASHVSDMLAKGLVFCVEVSSRSFRDLVKVCEQRPNMIPLLADATRPEEYGHMVEGVEFIYQDIAQRNQVDIFARNLATFEAAGGILIIKARSVNVNARPQDVYADVRRELASRQLRVVRSVDLDRFAKDHAAFMVES